MQIVDDIHTSQKIVTSFSKDQFIQKGMEKESQSAKVDASPNHTSCRRYGSETKQNSGHKLTTPTINSSLSDTRILAWIWQLILGWNVKAYVIAGGIIEIKICVSRYACQQAQPCGHERDNHLSHLSFLLKKNGGTIYIIVLLPEVQMSFHMIIKLLKSNVVMC